MADTSSSITGDDPRLLAPGRFVDSDHPAVREHAAAVVAGASGDRERAARLFRDARELLRYDPYSITINPEDYRASALLTKERGFCVTKAVLLCALCRAAGVPARLGFADVRNHLASPRLRAMMGTDLFVFHGYVEIWIEGRPVKATPAFNASLCRRFGVPPLEFDGTHDALLQPFDGAGRRHMEYVRERGLYFDLPLEEILTTFATTYRQGGEAPAPGGVVDPIFHDDAE
ncbi:MAG: transglutaminase domain-containing protein [Myxococcales bacterium]|nr:transglutaminase domain-containing protein [Myxococcales bacterium]